MHYSRGDKLENICYQADNLKFIPKLLKYYNDGQFPIDRLCKKYKASEIQKAVEDMNSGVTIKPILVW